ncbi:MAG: MATE family efflux transporter [Lachnospiraceae bacterium]|jgi:putative MATE family efflux protein|nr:MATE family efflux transporter [Lachnospiraceae bacterium]
MAGITSYIYDNKKRINTAIKMAWPSVLESFFVALAGLIDSLMVSSLGASAVAAVGLTTQPKFLGMALFIALNVSVSAIVARRRGEQDKKGANQALMAALVFTVAAGIAVSILCVILAEPIITLCGSNQDTHEDAVLYFRLIMGGMLFNIISLVINAAQRGAGNTRIAMKTNVTSNMVNMIGNYLIINGHFGFPALGIKGAAFATVFGTVIACIMSIRSLLKDGFISMPYVRKERIGLSFEPVRSMVKISSSVFTEQVLMRIGFMSTAVMAANLGTNAMAAHQVGMNIMSVSFSFGDGMQAAAVALIGRSLGEKTPDEAVRYGNICQRIGNVISLFLSMVYLLGGRALYRLFFEEPEIIDMGVKIMRLMVLIVILQIAQVIYMGCLRGAGDVIFTMIASTFSVTLVRTLGSYMMGYVFGLGLLGVWMGIMADQLSRFFLTTWRFKSGKWTSVKI